MLFDADTGEIVEFHIRAHTSLGYTREEFANLRLAEMRQRQPERTVPSTVADGLIA